VALVPFLKSFRHPSKVAVLMALCWALLAALGLDALCEDKGRRRWPLIVTAGAIAIALLAAVVVRGGRLPGLEPTAPGAREALAKAYRQSPPVIPTAEPVRDVPPALAAALARHDMVSPPVAARHGVFGAFDRDWLGLQPRGVRYLGLLFQVTEETPGALRLLQ